jgi:hypothetical protein
MPLMKHFIEFGSFNCCCVLLLYQLVSGDCGVLTAIKPGKAFVDMSSVDIETIIGLYEVKIIGLFC